mgnify:CR=1 FL=1
MSLWDWATTGRGADLIAGMAGASVAVALEWSGWPAGLRKLFIGAVTAYYTGPIGVPAVQWSIGHFVNVSETHSSSAGGFIMGVGGIVIAEIILKAWRLRRDEMRLESKDDET